MKYALSYPEPLRTRAVHAGNQQTLITDAPTDNGGLGEAYSPTDLVAVGLASCIMTILGLRPKARRLTILGMDATTEKKMSPTPRRIGRVIGRAHRSVGRGRTPTAIGFAKKPSRVPWRCPFTRTSNRTSGSISSEFSAQRASRHRDSAASTSVCSNSTPL